MVGDPVDVVTGAVVGIDREFQLPGAFELLWRRYYDSRRWLDNAGCGLGFRFEYDRRLRFDLDGMHYVAPDGAETHLPYLESDGEHWEGLGFAFTRIDQHRFELAGGDRITMHFAFDEPTQPAKLLRLSTREHAVSFGYDEKGRLATLADARGRSLRVKWDSLSRMQRVLLTDPDHDLNDKIVAEYEYDDAGRLVRTTDPYGHHLGYAYDKQGRLARFTDRNGYSFHYEYDVHGRCVGTHGDDGIEALTLAYDRDARMTTVKRGNGGTWQYFYDDNDALTTVITPSGGVTEYQYDAQGTLLREIRPDKSILTHELDETGHNYVDSLPTGNGAPPGANLDPFVFYARRYRIHRAPVVAQSPHGVAPASPARWQLGELFDEPHALPLKDTRPLFLTASENIELVRADRAEAGNHREVRDAFGILVRIERHDGPARQFHYDPNGNLARITDFDGSHTRYQLTSWNHVVASTDPLQQPSTYAYDRDENLTALTDAGGTRTDLRYDLERNLTEQHRHGRLRERSSYDFAGHVVQRAAADGRVLLRFEHDGQGLLKKRSLASGDVHGFKYAPLGVLSEHSSAAGTVELKPTPGGGFRGADLRDGKGVEHELTWGRVDTSSVLERFALQYYPFRDGATQMIVAPGERVHRVRSCGSGVIRKELADGSRETVQYDPMGRVLVRLSVDAGGKQQAAHYRYSGEGDLLQVIDSERGMTRYEYDAMHRVIRVHPPGDATPEEYAYDAAGNLIRKPGITYFGDLHRGAKPPDGPAPAAPATDHGIWLQNGNRLYRVHDDYFVYDERDHIAERRGPRGSTHYFYDELDRLQRIERSDGLRWSAKYDALGRRTEKKVGADTWTYYYCRDRLAAEVFPNGALRIYLYADLDRALVPFGFVDFDSKDAEPDSGKHYTYVTNHLGVPEEVRDEKGKLVWQAEIEPFGLAKVTVGEDFHQPLRFPGHYYDAETGLHYNRNRYYSPELGRYLQSDPVDLEGGHNLYAYAQDGNPLRDVDLFGLACARAEAVLEQARRDGLIDGRGRPLIPLGEMTPAQQRQFCVARATQLENRMNPRTASATTICVAIVRTGRAPNAQHRVIVTASTNNGRPPRSVRRGMLRSESPRTSQPNLGATHNGRQPNGLQQRNAAQRRRGEPESRDGLMQNRSADGQSAEPYQKRNENNPNGRTEHHAEQRAQNSTQDGETITAMGPSRPCCSGCNDALTESGNINRVDPSMRAR